jgi:hypothetical protein
LKGVLVVTTNPTTAENHLAKLRMYVTAMIAEQRRIYWEVSTITD